MAAQHPRQGAQTSGRLRPRTARRTRPHLGVLELLNDAVDRSPTRLAVERRIDQLRAHLGRPRHCGRDGQQLADNRSLQLPQPGENAPSEGQRTAGAFELAKKREGASLFHLWEVVDGQPEFLGSVLSQAPRRRGVVKLWVGLLDVARDGIPQERLIAA